MTYKYGLLQPSKPLKINCTALAEEEIIHISHIFINNFEITEPLKQVNLHPDFEAKIAAQSPLFKTVLQQLSLHCALAQQIQEHLGIPCFNQALILDCEIDLKSTPNISAQIFIPAYPLFDLQIISKIHQLALKSLAILAKGPEHLDEVFELLSKKNLEQLQKKIPHGKSTVPILRAAHSLKIPFFHLGHGVYQLGCGAKAMLFETSAVESDSMIGAKISQDKLITKHLLRQLGFPSPRGQHISSFEEAQRISIAWKKPVVIKPQNSDRGEGVTLNIQSPDEIPSAFTKAQQFSKAVVIEEMVQGICHRIVVVNGQILYVTKRNPKYITGDGNLSIAELIHQNNIQELQKVPYLRKILILLDEDALSYLSFQGYNPNHIPENQQRIHIRPTESSAWGGIAEDLTKVIHPANAALAIQIAKALRLTVCGLDFMTTDISIPWYENQGSILEANFRPALATNSQSGKLKIEQLISHLFNHGARINHRIFIGDEAAKKSALIAHQEELANDKAAYFIGKSITMTPSCEQYHQILSSKLYDRWYSLLINPTVESIIIHVYDDELIEMGLPIDQIEQYSIINNQIQFNRTPPENQQETWSQLIKLFELHSTI
jgi:cyanophycin synthetase